MLTKCKLLLPRGQQIETKLCSDFSSHEHKLWVLRKQVQETPTVCKKITQWGASGWTRVDSLWPPPLPRSKKVEALKYFLAWSEKQDFGGGFLRNGNIWLVLPFQCRWELITKLLTAAFNKFCVAVVHQFQSRTLNYCIWIYIHYSS